MLLANGYRLVDAAASKGPGGDQVAVAYISSNAGGLFQKDQYYNDPFKYGNKDGSLTPEQEALPGHEAHPQAGMAAGAGVGLFTLAAIAPTVATAWALGAGYDYAGDLISRAMGLSKDDPNVGKSLVVGGVAGATAPFFLPLSTLGSGTAGKIVVGGHNSALAGTGAFGATAMTNPGSSPDLSAGLGAAGALLGLGGKAVLPVPIGNAFDIWMQMLPGPAQAIIEQNQNGK
ncbi:membrane protein of unknown function [Burkholderia multivorans]